MTDDRAAMIAAYMAALGDGPRTVENQTWRLLCAARGVDPVTGDVLAMADVPPEVAEHERIAEAVAEAAGEP